MNRQPVYYMQTDKRWKDKPYRVPGESSTIGGSGCGPSCAAMVIETLTGKTFTPEDACKWSVEHGYKALNQGTYYSYFEPQFKAFGIECRQLSWVNTYGKPEHANHELALDMVKQGYYLIACMGPGTWTKGGHFVLVWWADGKVYINDPASTAKARTEGDLKTFKSQVKYYWWVDAREYNREDDDDMTKEKFAEYMDGYLAGLADKELSEWSEQARAWAEEKGIIRGDENGKKQYKKFCTREELIQILYNQSGEE